MVTTGMIEIFSYVDTLVGVLAGAAVGAVFYERISHLKMRSRFDRVIAKQRQRCRPLRDDEELTFDDSLDRMTVQIMERVREEIAH
jgi:hypothetical protein